MKRVGAISTALLGSVMTAKLYRNYNKKNIHKLHELSKPYMSTLREDLLEDIASKSDQEKKTCVVIGGGVAGLASVRQECTQEGDGVDGLF
jgi:tRNA A37 threonylcarbamoyltransferase TsaD